MAFWNRSRESAPGPESHEGKSSTDYEALMRDAKAEQAPDPLEKVKARLEDEREQQQFDRLSQVVKNVSEGHRRTEGVIIGQDEVAEGKVKRSRGNQQPRAKWEISSHAPRLENAHNAFTDRVVNLMYEGLGVERPRRPNDSERYMKMAEHQPVEIETVTPNGITVIERWTNGKPSDLDSEKFRDSINWQPIKNINGTEMAGEIHTIEFQQGGTAGSPEAIATQE